MVDLVQAHLQMHQGHYLREGHRFHPFRFRVALEILRRLLRASRWSADKHCVKLLLFALVARDSL